MWDAIQNKIPEPCFEAELAESTSVAKTRVEPDKPCHITDLMATTTPTTGH